MGVFFTFVLPILLVVNVPAVAMVRTLDWGMVGYHDRGDDRLPLGEPPVLLASPAVVPEREQLRCHRAASRSPRF